MLLRKFIGQKKYKVKIEQNKPKVKAERGKESQNESKKNRGEL
jgi:hypothetical protein